MHCHIGRRGGAIKTPDGKTGTAIAPDEADKNTEIDNDTKYGRGIGTCRPTNYYQYEIWGEKEKNDLRGPFNHDSWRRMEDLRYNDPGLKKNKQSLLRSKFDSSCRFVCCRFDPLLVYVAALQSVCSGSYEDAGSSGR